MKKYDVTVCRNNVSLWMCVVDAPNLRAAFNQVRTSITRDGGAFIPVSSARGIIWPMEVITQIDIDLRKS
jgi:hypothetical protein